MIYLSDAVRQLCDEQAGLDDISWLTTREKLLRWIRELFLEGQPEIHGRRAASLADGVCDLGESEKIKPHPNLKFYCAGWEAKQVRLHRVPEGGKLPDAAWRDLTISTEDFDWLRGHVEPPLEGVALANSGELSDSESEAEGRQAKRQRGTKADLRTAVTAEIKESGRPGKAILWKTFAHKVRKRCGQSSNVRGFGEKTIARTARDVMKTDK
jgi:hypothetical protein